MYVNVLSSITHSPRTVVTSVLQEFEDYSNVIFGRFDIIFTVHALERLGARMVDARKQEIDIGMLTKLIKAISEAVKKKWHGIKITCVFDSCSLQPQHWVGLAKEMDITYVTQSYYYHMIHSYVCVLCLYSVLISKTPIVQVTGFPAQIEALKDVITGNKEDLYEASLHTLSEKVFQSYKPVVIDKNGCREVTSKALADNVYPEGKVERERSRPVPIKNTSNDVVLVDKAALKTFIGELVSTSSTTSTVAAVTSTTVAAVTSTQLHVPPSLSLSSHASFIPSIYNINYQQPYASATMPVTNFSSGSGGCMSCNSPIKRIPNPDRKKHHLTLCTRSNVVTYKCTLKPN
jgi:hypothetical protein